MKPFKTMLKQTSFHLHLLCHYDVVPSIIAKLHSNFHAKVFQNNLR